jgi:hypothetical protein
MYLFYTNIYTGAVVSNRVTITNSGTFTYSDTNTTLPGVSFALSDTSNYNSSYLQSPKLNVYAIAGPVNPILNSRGIGVSSNWSIGNVQIKADVINIDNALDNEYASYLLQGNRLTIPYSTFYSQVQNISGQKPFINVSRAMTRLKSVFLRYMIDNTVTSDFLPRYRGVDKGWNCFWNQMAPNVRDLESTPSYTDSPYNPNLEIETQIQIGSKLFPQNPMRFVTEQFAQLRKTIGCMNSPFYAVDITPLEYISNRYVVAYDLEKVTGIDSSGENSKAGSLMTIKLNNLNNIDPTLIPNQIHIMLHAQMLLEISDVGCNVFD